MGKVNVPEISGKNRHYIGRLDGEALYLSKPSFDCNWYWGFGYIGNRNCHMHLNSELNKNPQNWFDSYMTQFTDIPEVLQDKGNLWKFVETFRTLYTLRNMADVCYTGGSHYCTPVVDLRDQAMYEQIVTVKMPALFEAIVDILENRQ